MTDETHANAAAVYNQAQLIALELLTGFYIGHSHLAEAEALSIEGDEFIGETPSDEGIKEFYG